MTRSDNKLFDNVEYRDIHAAQSILRALAHPLRLKILAFIDKHRTLSVHKIYTGLNLDQSITSQQLHILRTAGLVKTGRDGKYILYSLNYETINSIHHLVEEFRKDAKK